MSTYLVACKLVLQEEGGFQWSDRKRGYGDPQRVVGDLLLLKPVPEPFVACNVAGVRLACCDTALIVLDPLHPRRLRVHLQYGNRGLEALRRR